MPQCPYPETYIDEMTGKDEPNILYRIWHEGYEAHKLEIANQVNKITSLGQVLDNQVRQINELQKELAEQKAELQEKIKRYL